MTSPDLPNTASPRVDTPDMKGEPNFDFSTFDSERVQEDALQRSRNSVNSPLEPLAVDTKRKHKKPSDISESDLLELMQDGADEEPVKQASRPSKRSRDKPWVGMPWYQRAFIVPWFFFNVIWSYLPRVLLALRWGVTQWIGARPALMVRSAEILLWPLFFVAVGWLSNDDNPLYINEGFPWPWVGAWLIAMRYGALGGSIAAVILLACWYLMVGGEFPRLYFLGGAIMTLIAGEFGSLWLARMSRMREAMEYQDDKIERLTRRLYLLKLSHNELEYELVDRPGTLSDALIELRGKLTPETLTGHDKLPGAGALLQFLAQYGQLEVAALHLYIDGPRPLLEMKAKIGDPPNVAASDPMIERAIYTRQSVHLQEQLVDTTRKTALILVAPILDADNAPIGILTVNRMPFLALHADNLRNVWVMVQAYTEYLRMHHLASPYALEWQESPMELQHEFAWLQRMHMDAGLQSWCVLWQVWGLQRDEITELLKQEHSSGEMCWALKRDTRLTVVSLLPFVTVQQLMVQKRRLQAAIERAYGRQTLENYVMSKDISLERRDAWSKLKLFVEGQP